MNVVWHHDDTTDQPFEKLARFTDFIEHDPDRTFVHKHFPPVVCATSNEVDDVHLVRQGDRKTMQMFV